MGFVSSKIQTQVKNKLQDLLFSFFMMDWLIFGLVILVIITNSKIQNGENVMDVYT